MSYAQQLQEAHKQRLARMGGNPYHPIASRTRNPRKTKCRGKRVYYSSPGPKMKAILFPVSISGHPKIAPKRLSVNTATAPTLQQIMDEICARFGLEADEICQVKGRRYVKLAKHEFCWRAWHQTPCVVTRISRFLGSENHHLVSRGVCTHQARIDRGLI